MKQKKLKTDLNNAKKFFALIVIAIVALFYLSGCVVIWIPTPEHGYSNEMEVNKDMLEQLQPGITTKDDVRLLIGDHPGIDSNKPYCYFWSRKDGYLLGASMAPNFAAESTQDNHAVCLEFMPDGKLKRFKQFEDGWFRKDLPDQISDWEKDGN